MQPNPFLVTLHHKLLSDETKEVSERVILIIAIVSFVIHLGFIYLLQLNLLPSAITEAMGSDSKLLKNPIAAIYTPFSFILIYEVYLLIYYLPKSITTYINKQYEIITLIVIRRIFKDLSSLELSSNWFEIKDDLQFTYDIVASILLFYLLYLFATQSKDAFNSKTEAQIPTKVINFIRYKKTIATALVPLLLGLALYNLIGWTIGTFTPSSSFAVSFKNINNIFFDEFFTVLIITDVLLLLLSFFYTDKFHKVIRNSGFIISTILIRLSFSVDGLINTILIISAVVFGLLILVIHNNYERKEEERMEHE